MGEIRPIAVPTMDFPVGHSPLYGPLEHIRDLIDGGDWLKHDPLFATDRWNLAGHPGWPHKQGNFTTLNFEQMTPYWRTAAKEFALLQLRPALAVDRAAGSPLAHSWAEVQEPISPVTAQGNLKMLAHGLRVLDTASIYVFTDPSAWDRVAALLIQPMDVADKRRGGTLSRATGRGRAQQLVALWEVAQIAGRHQLLGPERPFGGRDTSVLFHTQGPHNSVRPHEAVGHALGLSAWIIDNIADDIVTHVEWWSTHRTENPALGPDELRESMLDLVETIAEANAGAIPAIRNTSGKLTIAGAALGRLLGAYDSDDTYPAARWVKNQLGDSVELSDAVSPCPLPLTALPTGDGPTPWAPRLLGHDEELDLWQRRLVFAAMYYLSATLMLRDSQLALLPFDPVSSETRTRPDGTTYLKYTLHAYRTKNRSAPEPTTVPSNSRVAQIVTLLHRLQQALGYAPANHPETGRPFLFDQRLATPVGRQAHGNARQGIYLDQGLLKNLKNAAAFLHGRGVIARDLEDLTVNMRQVRITTAQAYAVREHGQALAAAFGQWDTAKVAAGYVGDVYRLITPLEPEDTLAVHHEDTGRRLRAVGATDPAELTGSGQTRLRQTLARDPALTNPDPLSASRLRRLGKSNANVEQGPLTLCLYQPEGALCGGKGKPDFRLCLPGRCRNSVMTRADRARYELLRRQHLALHSPVLRRAADKMHDANPDIATEFADHADAELQAIISEHIHTYIAAALRETS